jgi:hypothetical protein
VFDAPAWLDEAGQLPGVPIRARVVEDGDATWTATVISVALAACRLIGDAGKPPQIFLSHAKRDLAATDRLAEQLAAYIRKHTTGTAFFDATDLAPGHPLSAQLAEAVGRGVFVAVLGDSYASRPWCESEMLGAKRSGAPTLAIHVLQHGELRSYPYSGNGPTVVWKPGSGVEHIALRAIVEWLRYRHFALDAERRFRDDVPWLIPLPRPPELLDLAQGPLLESAPTVVMHPDPEVSRHEREVLRQARPRMRLVTPSTFYRGLHRGVPRRCRRSVVDACGGAAAVHRRRVRRRGGRAGRAVRRRRTGRAAARSVRRGGVQRISPAGSRVRGLAAARPGPGAGQPRGARPEPPGAGGAAPGVG